MRQEYEKEPTPQTPVLIHIMQRTQGFSRIYISPTIADEWKLTEGETVVVSIGTYCKLRVQVHLRHADEGSFQMYFLPGLNLKRYLPPSTSLWAVFDSKTHEIRLGPTIGILTVDTRSMFGPQSGTFKDLMKVGRRKGAMVYAFTPADIDWQAHSIKGYQCVAKADGGRRWVRRTYPFPDVVYNRIPKRMDERKPQVVQTIRRLESHLNHRLYNSRFLNKWEVHCLLTQKDDVHSFIIPTSRCIGPVTLAESLQNYNSVFLKPVSDSLGNGAMKISKKARGYLWEVNIPGRGTRRKLLPSLQSACRLVYGVIRGKPYLIQKCVDLVEYRGRSFDVRVLVQRDDMGIWRTTGMAARVAQKNRITTHIPNGGHARPIMDTLQTAFKYTDVNPEEVYSQLSTAAVLAAQAVDSRSDRLYGEVSLDIGIDCSGKVWIFEVNAKPFRFDEENIRQLSLRRAIDFSTWLAGYRAYESAQEI